MNNFKQNTSPALHKTLAIQAAIEQGLLHDNQPHIALVYKQGIYDTCEALINAFPENTRHCFSVKANPYKKILKVFKKAGIGAEVASAPELELALKAKFSSKDIIFDAPVKTTQEIDRALALGIDINLDNFQELEHVAIWFEVHSSNSNIGFRINPQISTEKEILTSKFGIGLNDKNNRQKLINAYQQYSWLTSLHVHIGTVNSPVSLLVNGVSVVYKLANEINEVIGNQQISNLDIGGGLAVNISDDNITNFKEYADALQQAIPDIFNGDYQLTTEFGSALISKNAITVGRVEYTKNTGGQQIALTHLGVQTLMQTIYNSEKWKRRITAFTSEGLVKTGNEVSQNIAGPSCITGDLIAKELSLPLLKPNDYILVHDTGGYHFSSHFQYNALPRLPVYAYTIDENKQVTFKSFSRGQNIQDVITDYS